MKTRTIHSWGDLIPPWPTPGLWQAANQSMAFAIHRHRDRLQDAVALAQQIRSNMEALGPLMHELCEQTCPACTDHCCRRATVWFDFKDLLTLHMLGEALPPGQLIGQAHRTCRYLGIEGCVLPRIQRPFVCTWYICAAQKEVLHPRPLYQKQFLGNRLEALKNGRDKLEYMFIRSVTQ